MFNSKNKRFPRIDVDRSGGIRNGWIYGYSRKTVAPATDVSDVILPVNKQRIYLDIIKVNRMQRKRKISVYAFSQS
jgi:hypothetical protein